MLDEMFKTLSAPLPDSGKYLERIGMGPIKKADKETLDRLVLAHLRSVPFENLDVYDLHADIALGIPELYDKIVTRRRGGYCFELNAAFTALLQSLGYNCVPIAVRVVWHATCFMPLSHRGTIVTIDGVRYFVDVGFGGPSAQSALLLDERGEQPSGPNVFVIDKTDEGTAISYLADGEKVRTLLFYEEPCNPVDFLALNEYTSKFHASLFRQVRLLNLLTETGVKTISDNVFKIHSGGDTIEETLDTEEKFKNTLKNHFGIVIDFPLKLR